MWFTELVFSLLVLLTIGSCYVLGTAGEKLSWRMKMGCLIWIFWLIYLSELLWRRM